MRIRKLLLCIIILGLSCSDRKRTVFNGIGFDSNLELKKYYNEMELAVFVYKNAFGDVFLMPGNKIDSLALTLQKITDIYADDRFLKLIDLKNVKFEFSDTNIAKVRSVSYLNVKPKVVAVLDINVKKNGSADLIAINKNKIFRAPIISKDNFIYFDYSQPVNTKIISVRKIDGVFNTVMYNLFHPIQGFYQIGLMFSKCPYGHKDLKAVRMIYNFPYYKANYFYQVTNDNIMDGGDCVSSSFTKMCKTCGIVFRVHTKTWLKTSKDKTAFHFPLNKIIFNFPIYSPVSVTPFYDQSIYNGNKHEESLFYKSKANFDSIAISVEKYLNTYNKKIEIEVNREKYKSNHYCVQLDSINNLIVDILETKNQTQISIYAINKKISREILNKRQIK